MLGSRSTRTKLIIIFFATLLLLGVTIPSYIYVQSLIPKPASFKLTNLKLDPDWIQFGDPVKISVNVTNIGDEAGNYTVTVTIADEPIASKTIQLLGKEGAIVEVSATGIAEGNHTLKVGDLTALLRVTSEAPARPAKMEITNLGISRIQAAVGEPIIVSVIATNTGDEAGTFELILYVNDIQKSTRNIQLDSGETKTEEFEVVEQSEGTYKVKVGNKTKTFEITSEAEPPKPAEFQVTDLKVNPTSVLAGEVVTISVNVINIGEESGSYSVNLNIDDNLRETINVTLSGGATRVAEFEITETDVGSYNVEIDGQFGQYTVEASVEASKDIVVYSMFVSPYEVWEGEIVTIKAKADNLANEPGTLQARILAGGEVATTEIFQLEAGETNKQIELTIVAGSPDSYAVKFINLGDQTNTLSGFFQVVPDGFHTLSVSGTLGLTFLLNGVNITAPYFELLEVGTYALAVPQSILYNGDWFNFTRWEDGSTSLTRTVDLSLGRVSANPTFIFTGTSCPSLYTWNGTNYEYVAEVSNHGWLGYINYISENPDWNIIYWRNNPWDYIKLDQNQLHPRNNEYYDLILTQNWDEIFYLDAAHMMVVDHPSDVDVYSTMVEQYIDPDYMGQIYTVNKENQLTPLSAFNEKGEDMLPMISDIDDIFTSGKDGITSPSWDNINWNRLTLDLGDLSNAEQIKLVVRGVVDWGSPDDYNTWIDSFFVQPVPNGTQITPPPYMEVKDANGNWVRVQESRQFPIPPDSVPRTFVVDLTGLFPTDDYSLRINNFWNVTFDYIGVDTSPQREIIIHQIYPEANLYPVFPTNSQSEGNFTRYGNVTKLILNADDKFVIGRQGDEVSLTFPDDIGAPPEGMERDIFFYVSLWFKDEYGNWGFGFGFTVDPLPFQNMSGFPYPPTESYPYTQENLEYLSEYNTRQITIP
ncbi:hypothetical protein AC477_04365 [miscellaneous Crenarchaeota group-1 archaeon SG8-32-1]|uniref:CARDB domain-containing protein n=1 Tax=miscellaneous Crenarchaeota group-1 archaeon SG8-32-1 TaxID=1685124 RepID=A0A0M0BRZ8_9ARCH|nr:MAG: hypothetical protein AC477_04365 [miscellaneous Crenarchaeota group-1 archaeon SG8-32-1]